MCKSERHNRIAVLSFNIFIRPEGIHSGKWLQTGDFKDLRMQLLLRKMEQFDIVILQEMFEVGFRQKRFLKSAYDIGFKYHCGSVWPTVFDTALIDGGLLILSRYPIVKRDRITFERGLGADGVCAKGALYAKIVISPNNNHCLHVFTTHTQAGERLPEYTVRKQQLLQFISFVHKQLEDDDGSKIPVLITGDINMDARHDVVHLDQYKIESMLSQESRVYQNFVHQLSIGLSHRTVLDLMKEYDQCSKLDGDFHPITNGNGHGNLSYTATLEERRADGKCIDYMFYSPPPAECDTLLKILPDLTGVDLCTMKELVGDAEMQLPITHLSDHYGLRVTFKRNNEFGDKVIEMLEKRFPPDQYAQQTEILWQWKVFAVLGAITLAGAAMLSTSVYCLRLLSYTS